MTSHAVNVIMGLVLTAMQTVVSMMNAHTAGWRSWVPGVGMLAAFVPLLRSDSPPLSAHPGVLTLALGLWLVALILRPQPRIWLRRTAMGACAVCIAALELDLVPR
jgi:hypothetical protein